MEQGSKLRLSRGLRHRDLAAVLVPYRENEEVVDHSEKIAADKSSLGFDFQDLVYVEKLIELKPGQTLGLELLDDIHIEKAAADGSIEDLMLIQVKHSVGAGNITDRDIDLWKTLDNWLKLVPELPSHRTLTFQLYTNKSLNNQTFVSLLKAPRDNIEAILDHIRATDRDVSAVEAKKKTTDALNPLAKHVTSVSEATDEELRFLFERFEFHSNSSSILARISSSLRVLSIPSSRVDETRKHVIGAFKESKFSKIVEGKKVVISFENFRTDMGFDRIVQSARADPVDFDRFIDMYYEHQRPDNLSFRDSKFYEQLKDIGIDEDEIIDRGIEMVLAEKFMETLREDGLFTADENKRLERNGESIWKQLHGELHRETDLANEAAHHRASRGCYDKTIKNRLKADNVELPINLSSGKFIKLSNLSRIGWRKDWKDRFNT